MMKLTLKPFFKLTVAGPLAAMLFVGTAVFSQENTEEKLLLVKAKELVYSNPDETIKIANHLLKKSVSAENKAAINVLLSNSYISKGDFNTSLSYIFQASGSSNTLSDSLKIEIAYVKAGLSRRLHLYAQMDGYLSEIQDIVAKSETGDYSSFTLARVDVEKVYAAVDRKKGNDGLKFLKAAQNESSDISGKFAVGHTVLLADAIVTMCLDKFEASEKSFNDAYSAYKTQKIPNTIFEIRVLNGLAQLYYQKKEYDKAISLLLLALPKAEKLANTGLQESITYQLADNYLSLGNKEAHQKYFDKFIAFNTLAVDSENEAVNSFYNLVSAEQEQQFASQEERLIFFAYIGFAAILAIAISGVVLFRLNKARISRLKEIIGYLEVTDKLLVKPAEPDKKEFQKKISIPTETEQAILAKLKKFENSTRYTHKDMSLATLAAQLDINTKYLSETINKHYHDNFNTYINRLRINYIIEKLKNDPEYLNYKISYLAEESGFSSHSSFATVFKSITGIAPTVFIELIGKEVTQKKA